MASYPDLRPRRLRGRHQLDFRFAELNDPAAPRPAQRPGGEQHLLAGLDVQAVHRLRGPDEGRDHARRASTSTGASTRSRAARRRAGAGCEFDNANRAAYGKVDLRRALSVSSDVYFYRLGELFWNNQDRVRRRPPSRTAPKLFGLGRRHRGPAARARAAGTVPNPRLPDCAGPGEPRGLPQQGLVHRRQRQPRHRPGRAAGHAPAAGQRLRHHGQRRHGVLAVDHPGHPRPQTGQMTQDVRAPRARSRSTACAGDPPADHRRLDPGGQRRGGHGVEGLRRVPARPVPGGGQDRHRRGRTARPTPPSSPRSGPSDQPRYAVVAVLEESGFGADAAVPLVRQVFEQIRNPQPAGRTRARHRGAGPRPRRPPRPQPTLPRPPASSAESDDDGGRHLRHRRGRRAQPRRRRRPRRRHRRGDDGHERTARRAACRPRRRRRRRPPRRPRPSRRRRRPRPRRRPSRRPAEAPARTAPPRASARRPSAAATAVGARPT